MRHIVNLLIRVCEPDTRAYRIEFIISIIMIVVVVDVIENAKDSKCD